jgi:hypothetical protein
MKAPTWITVCVVRTRAGAPGSTRRSTLWNYLTTPFLLAYPSVQVREISPWQQHDQTWRRLRATFPASITTHSAEQVFYFGDDGLLRRLDYTVEADARMPFPAIAARPRLPRRHTSAVAPVAFSAVVRASCASHQTAPHLATDLRNNGGAPVGRRRRRRERLRPSRAADQRLTSRPADCPQPRTAATRAACSRTWSAGGLQVDLGLVESRRC